MIILRKDLRFFSHDRYFYFKRTFFVVVISLLFIFYGFSTEHYHKLSNNILNQFSLFSFVCFLVSIPTIATDSILKEQQQQTLALLNLSNISYHQIIYEKFYALLVTFFSYYLGIVPVLFICYSFGGISAAQVIQLVVVQLSFISVVAALGLLVASFHFSSQTQVLAFLATLLWLALSMFIAIIPNIISLSSLASMVCQAFSPFLVAEKILTEISWFLTLGNLSIGVIVTLLSLYFATKLLNNHALTFGEVTMTKNKNTHKINDNPIFWRDYYKIYGGYRSFCFKFVVTLLVIPICTYVAHYLFMYLYARPVPFNLLSVTVTGLIIAIPCAIFTFFSGCTRSFVRETKRGSFDFLLLTSLSSREIINGKSRAILYYSAPFIIITILFTIILVAFFPKYTAGKWLYISMSIANLLAIFSCAFFLSLQVKTSGTAAIYTYVLFTILHGATSLVSNLIANSRVANVKIMSTYYTLVTIGYIIIAIIFFIWTNKKLRT
ncbi:hypothetical protein [Candidatus Uabimicrobium sp. HlEnr_7]|uniref:hypothetical protein n=1 Tax=Candidatus Uabimicrobium helgolandensis TaxID=3095367 RepID=UPI003558DB8D